ncbi:MAG: ferric reductase-like transmembrane domain-containing protein [Bacteroidia bacterium]
MSIAYTSVSWNTNKKIYDGILLGFVLTYLSIFICACLIIYPEITIETTLIRATSTLAFLLLHVILSIGPLARLNKIFLPLLYNRRHLGVTMFLIALVHGTFSIFQFHALGNISPLVSVLSSNTHYTSFIKFPFQSLGLLALIILSCMAASSHDFWLNQLSPKIWKILHMGVYIAYGLLVMHVLLGVIQLEHSPAYFILLAFGVCWVSTLHVLAAWKENKRDSEKSTPSADGFIQVCDVSEIPENRAKVVTGLKERIAIFKYQGKLSAVSNVCKHQNGPLGEGKIIDGCITCPWHGYQYLPHNGKAPAPFKEKVATYNLRLTGTKIWLDPKPNEEGAEVMPLDLHL